MIIPEFNDVITASERIKPWIHRTPVMTSKTFDALTGAELLFKCENFQKAGAFKARGACNAVFGLDEKDAARGVATHSSGNHAQALAYAAARRGIEATLVMPENAPEAKRAAVRDYGGRIVSCEASTSSRESTLQRVIDETGAEMVHPSNDSRVIAGQGTCALELHEQAGPLDAIVAPIGGGGLIAGTCLSMANISPDTRIIAAEPAAADDAYQSLQAGRIIEYDAPQTIADGLRSSMRSLNWHFVSRNVDEVLLVSEDEIARAMFLVWQRMKIVIEPSSAVAVAAIIGNRDRFAGQRVGVILTGGNVDLTDLPWMNGLGLPETGEGEK